MGMSTAAKSSDIPGTARPAAGSSVPAHRNAPFLRYLAGQAVSTIGDQVWYVALSWSAVRHAGAATAGVVVSVSAVPRLFLLLFGGVVADRFDVRRLMLGSDVLRTAVCLAAAAVALADPGISLLIVMALLFGTVDALFMPAAGSMQPRLLTADQYAGGAVLATLSARLALTVGAPLGGFLVAHGGLSTALLVDAVTFALSVGALASVRPRPIEPDGNAEASREPYWHSFRSGLRYLRGHAVLGPLVLVTFLTNAGFVGPLNVGGVLLAQTRGWGAQGVGDLLTGFGVGAAAGALLMARVRIRRRLGVWIAVLGAAQGVAVAAMAWSPSVLAASAVTLLVGLLSGPMAVLTSVVQQRETEDAFRGRVSSVVTLTVLGIVPLAMGLMGVAVAVLGTTGAFAVSGAVEVAGLVGLLSGPFRRVGAEPAGNAIPATLDWEAP